MDRLVFRFLPQMFMPCENGIDGGEKRSLALGGQMKVIAHPHLQLAASLGVGVAVEEFLRAHLVDIAAHL
ncbi:MAG TPA: hypothetical protein VH497_19075 [Vicinamibacterales bacterium]